MKSMLSIVVDCIFCLLITFLLSLVILNSFLSANLSLVLSALLSTLITLLVTKLLLDKHGKGKLKRKQNKEKEVLLTQLNFSKKPIVLNHFLQVFNKKGYSITAKDDKIYFNDKPIVIKPSFGFCPVQKSDLVNLFNSLRPDDVGYILSQSFSSEVVNFCALFKGKIVLVDQVKTYEFLKSNDALMPEKYTFEKHTERGVKIFSNLFKKKKAKNHLVFGLIFLFMSYFVTIKLYYLFFGCVFLTLALASRLFGKDEQTA